jgi:hypothetical protein
MSAVRGSHPPTHLSRRRVDCPCAHVTNSSTTHWSLTKSARRVCIFVHVPMLDPLKIESIEVPSESELVLPVTNKLSAAESSALADIAPVSEHQVLARGAAIGEFKRRIFAYEPAVPTTLMAGLVIKIPRLPPWRPRKPRPTRARDGTYSRLSSDESLLRIVRSPNPERALTGSTARCGHSPRDTHGRSG